MTLKKVCALLLSAVLCVSLAACGGGKKPANDPFDFLPKEEKIEYTKLTAEHEDSELNLFFDHAYGKQVQTDTTPTGRDTYKMYMAGNEIENCEFILSSEVEKKGLSVELSDFVGPNETTITPAIFYLEYFDIKYAMRPDACTPINCINGGVFDIAANTSQIFLVEVRTPINAVAGDYEATLDVKNSNGEQVKTAKIFLKVWNYTLSEETASTVSMHLDAHQGINYKNYYDFMLEHRICAYNLPYDFLENTERAAEYLNNPRVRSFIPHGYHGYNQGKVSRIAEILNAHPEWKEKAFFYTLDEPEEDDSAGKDVRRLRDIANNIRRDYPDYYLVSPFFLNNFYFENEQDLIEYLSGYMNIWCPKPHQFTSQYEYMVVDGALQPFQDEWQDEEYGTFAERLSKRKAEGDKVWWYTCWDPLPPYITLNSEERGVLQRQLAWQQKYFGIDGYLYYAINIWQDGHGGWDSIPADSPSGKCWGDGQLMYNGNKYGLDVPVASIRMYIFRDGVEDYQMLTMLEEKLGTKKTNELIGKITSGVLTYTSDDDEFATWRVRLGNYLEKLLNE